MKPMFGFGRRSEPLSTSTEDDLDPVDRRDATPEEMDDDLSISAPDTAVIRPDLGPPAPGPQSGSQPGSGLGLVISFAVATVVFVLAIYASGSATTNPLPLAQTTNALYWFVGAIVTVGAGIGAVYADRTAARATDRALTTPSESTAAWIVPVVATATAIVLVATFHNATMIVAGPLIAFLGNAGSLLSRDLLDDFDESAQRTASTIHTLVIYSVAFLALSAIYLNKVPTPVAAFFATLVTTLLVIESLERRPISDSRKISLALLAGGAVAAVMTALLWWPTYGLTGGAVLLVAFYCAAGIIQDQVERKVFGPRDMLLYGLVPLGLFVVLAVMS